MAFRSPEMTIPSPPPFIEPPARCTSVVSFQPAVHDEDADFTLPPIDPDRTFDRGKESKWKNLANIYHARRNDAELCISCAGADAKAFLLGKLPKKTQFRVGTLAEIRCRKRCWLCSTIYRLLVHDMPHDLFRKCDEGNMVLHMMQEPGAWFYPAMLGGVQQDDPEWGRSNPCAWLRLEEQDSSNDEKDINLVFKHYNFVYNERPSEDRLPKIRQFRHFEIDYALADYGKIQSWLSACEQKDHELFPSARNSSLGTIPKLHLIDVETRAIVPREGNVSYVALSYVWGVQQTSEDDGVFVGAVVAMTGRSPFLLPRLLPPKVAQTIEDAMVVVTRLGERFLWVDAYCVDQNDSPARERAINHMHHIYEGATLTICALSSLTADSGLVGVSQFLCPRPQFTADTASGCFIASARHYLWDDIFDSPWLQRGWTLQESVLSRRLLCFGDHGVSLWCQKELFQDCVDSDTGEQRKPIEFRASGPDAAPFCFESLSPKRWSFDSYCRLVDDYSVRNLSVAADASRAIAGLLNQISTTTDIRFAFGVPVHEVVPALLWIGYQLRRNHLYPSWSWLGWQGGVHYLKKLDYSNPGLLSDGRVFYHLMEFPGGNRSIVPTSTTVIQNDDINSGLLVLCSQLAHFDISLTVRDGDLECRPTLISSDGPDSWTPSKGDRWELRDGTGQLLTGEEFWFAKTCAIYTGEDTSTRILRTGVDMVDCLLLQRWTEVYPVAEREEELWDRYGDRAWLMVLLRDPGGTAERIGVLDIPFKHWEAAKPHLATVCIV